MLIVSAQPWARCLHIYDSIIEDFKLLHPDHQNRAFQLLNILKEKKVPIQLSTGHEKLDTISRADTFPVIERDSKDAGCNNPISRCHVH